ncbi:hypothetical protein MesoLj113a_57370 [Mesorhizobium sp. 113-1-2]|uniref:WbqC family protein n=1 Tax=Mesorhizobium sp. 113-1-2 TaxID=2744515 RepID=UPI0008197DDD|nr:WbqC family protein [Mesorhizobium sp. 113-1-2]BAV51747.1 WbqC-like family protein [Mesorhizobium loti]BCG74579.1 hypothetical protein MesoLj113a_57370 [Mesorhizobium sp. 113-1-2]
MTKRVAILQSNYIPWKGYFDLIASVDEFILYDDMQYTRRDWRNRNKIKTPAGAQWLTVPVVTKGRYLQKILETEIDGADWAQSHWRQLQLNYRRASCFSEIAEWLEPLYSRHYTHISELNRCFIAAICGYLGITTAITSSSAYQLNGAKTERLADICAQAGGTVYVSGPSAKDYIVPEVFDLKGIDLEWFDYEGYPVYPQLWTGFIHQVSILDLLFNCGKQSPQFMRFVAKRA